MAPKSIPTKYLDTLQVFIQIITVVIRLLSSRSSLYAIIKLSCNFQLLNADKQSTALSNEKFDISRLTDLFSMGCD